MKDLWGNEITPKKPKPKGRCNAFKIKNNYRKGGTSTCKDCLHIQRFEYHNKYYHKCELLGFSHSTATDIRLSFVCDQFDNAKKVL